jgi:mannosyl-oligosaccharide glucosidase
MAKDDRGGSSSPERSDESVTGRSKPGGMPGRASGVKSPKPPKGAGKKKKGGSGDNSGLMSMPVKVALFGLIGIPLLGYVAQNAYMKHWVLPRVVSTPCPLPKVLADDAFSVQKSPDMFWGSYAANLYFGLRTRSPQSPAFGLMWFEQPRFEVLMPRVRHWCSQQDNLAYGWNEHDGRSFGKQEIIDGSLVIRTSFVKRPGGQHGGDWTARIEAQMKEDGSSTPDRLTSLVVYFAIPDSMVGSGGILTPKVKTVDGTEKSPRTHYITGISGKTPELGGFRLRFSNPLNAVARSYAATKVHGSYANIKESLINATDIIPVKSKYMAHYLGLRGALSQTGVVERSPNLVALQITFIGNTSLDVVFESDSYTTRPDTMIGTVYDKHLEVKSRAFRERFTRIFQISDANFPEIYQQMARFALSNLLGSVSYFYGSSLVLSEHTAQPVRYGPFALYTSVPSRPFFPRGFLWDEGFHHLLIRHWDTDLSLEILGSWFDLMNVEGWIPREQILGEEAEQRVPSEFIIQKNANANPPMFFYLLSEYFTQKDFAKQHRAFLERAYPRLELWYSWLNRTQVGPVPGSYRWRGRNQTTQRELNPKTLTSGFDDYPRASHPTDSEYHLDLLCWMALSSRFMGQLAAAIKPEQAPAYKATAERLSAPEHIDALHWSEKTKRYCDYGLHTRNVKLERPRVGGDPNRAPPQYQPPPEMVRIVRSTPQHRLVSDTFGYVSLFPFLLRMLPADSPKLGQILADLPRPDLLWTPYGLRSLAQTAPLYKVRNTEHDPAYWRGRIWLNINFLAVRALHYYSNAAGPHRDSAFDVYSQLRANLVSNMLREFQRSGQIWEHYDEETGEGRGHYPFTGWSSLILLIMGEKYD